MSVIFKSNVRATAVIQNISGFQGPLDFTANADFSNNQYIKNGLKSSINEIIKAPNQQPNPVLINEFGDVSISPSAQARRSYLVEHSTFGLLNAVANSNCYNIAANLITLPETNVRAYALYACKGSAQITELDLSKITVIKGTGTLKDPLIFYYKSSTTLNVLKSSDAENIVCVSLVGNRVPYAPFGAPGAVIDSTKNIDISLINQSEFTIVLRVIEPKRGLDASMNGIATYLKIVQDATNAVTVAKARGSDLRTNFLKNGVSEAAWQAAETNRQLDTLVLTLKNGIVRCALNGTILPHPNISISSTFKATAIEIMTQDEAWGSGSPESALLNLIVYNRALTLEEMAKCSFK